MLSIDLKLPLEILDWKLAYMLATNPFLINPWGENQGRKCDFLFKIMDSTLKINEKVFFI
jgi:hypothetical protein